MKKDSFFKKIFSSNDDCCTVEFEEIKDDKKVDKNDAIYSESTCCSSKTE